MLFRVDHQSVTSLTEQIAAQVRAAIASDELSRGERLPPARELATALRVNMHTVLRAYQRLRDEGLIEMRQGRGAFVTDTAGTSLLQIGELTRQLVTEAKKLGLTPAEVHARLDRLMGETA